MITPPNNTIAVVVDISKAGGRIKIYDTPSGSYVDSVAMEDSEALVMVPWDSSWWYYSIGSLKVRYIIR